MTSDSDSRPTGRDAQQARGEARQSGGGNAASPKGQTMTNSCSTKAADAKVPCPNNSALDELVKHLTALGLTEQVSAVQELREEYAGLCHDFDRLAARESEWLNPPALEVADTRQDRERGSGASAAADQALAVPATPANAVDGPPGFAPSRCVPKRQIHFVWAAGQTVRVVIPDGFRLAVLSPGKSPSVVPTDLMPPGHYDLRPETLPGGSYPMAVTTCDAAHVELTEHIDSAQVDRLFAIAMEAQWGATGNTDATAEGGDGAGPKDIAHDQD